MWVMGCKRGAGRGILKRFSNPQGVEFLWGLEDELKMGDQGVARVWLNSCAGMLFLGVGDFQALSRGWVCWVGVGRRDLHRRFGGCRGTRRGV